MMQFIKSREGKQSEIDGERPAKECQLQALIKQGEEVRRNLSHNETNNNPGYFFIKKFYKIAARREGRVTVLTR
jgi:hypothetical protein